MKPLNTEPLEQKKQPSSLFKMDKENIELLKHYWYERNPFHENNADSGEDMFWGTVLCVFQDYYSKKKQVVESSSLPKCFCEQRKLELNCPDCPVAQSLQAKKAVVEPSPVSPVLVDWKAKFHDDFVNKPNDRHIPHWSRNEVIEWIEQNIVTPLSVAKENDNEPEGSTTM